MNDLINRIIRSIEYEKRYAEDGLRNLPDSDYAAYVAAYKNVLRILKKESEHALQKNT